MEIHIHFDEPSATTYKSKTVIVRGNTWRIMQVAGKYNYISVCKKTNNPFGGVLGKEFPTWDDATRYYKSPEMKTELLMAEIEMK